MDGPRHASRAVRPHWPGVFGAGLIATFVFAVPGAAQNLADVQRELSEMRRHYDAALKRLQRDYARGYGISKHNCARRRNSQHRTPHRSQSSRPNPLWPR